MGHASIAGADLVTSPDQETVKTTARLMLRAGVMRGRHGPLGDRVQHPPSQLADSHSVSQAQIIVEGSFRPEASRYALAVLFKSFWSAVLGSLGGKCLQARQASYPSAYPSFVSLV